MFSALGKSIAKKSILPAVFIMPTSGIKKIEPPPSNLLGLFQPIIKKAIGNKLEKKAVDTKSMSRWIRLKPWTIPTVAAGILGVSSLGKFISDKILKTTSYNQMFEKYPELKNIDKEKINDAWNVMRRYSPSLTHNPIVAGSFIKNILEYGGIHPNEVKVLIETEKGYGSGNIWHEIKELATGMPIAK